MISRLDQIMATMVDTITDNKVKIECNASPQQMVTTYEGLNETKDKHTSHETDTKSVLKSNIVSNNRYKCVAEDCGYLSTDKTSLEQHMEMDHKNECLFKCNHYSCDAMVRTPEALRDHINDRHSLKGLKSFECDYSGCGRVFDRKYTLEKHWFTHSVDKPLKCSVNGCHYQCIRKRQMQCHTNGHIRHNTIIAIYVVREVSEIVTAVRSDIGNASRVLSSVNTNTITNWYTITNSFSSRSINSHELHTPWLYSPPDSTSISLIYESMNAFIADSRAGLNVANVTGLFLGTVNSIPHKLGIEPAHEPMEAVHLAHHGGGPGQLKVDVAPVANHNEPVMVNERGKGFWGGTLALII
ncbi:unnamed protein product [Oppiella nova]|uniref:C2H2-type domain-containing protein n=1 Tax=Oppiella nova TaxID=334625 RepID=A0A7R9QQ78_9ACAR|nr:unnamed protein product [Oppiella nova]CAG2169808.1 unnamed protein product [Oppiella nova]